MDSTAGRRRAQGRSSGSDRARESEFGLTVRAALLALFVVSVAGVVAGTAVGVSILPGIAFTVACLASVCLTRQRDLLSLVVSPPLIFLVATLAGELGGAVGQGSGAKGLAVGMVTKLTTGAPWLFAGTVLVLIIALFRGLPGNVRQLRDEVRGGRPPGRSRGGGRRRKDIWD